LPGEEVRVEDKDRKTVTVVEATEYLGLSRTRIQEMVDRGVLKAECSPARSTFPARR
jgi:hypothetical protein